MSMSRGSPEEDFLPLQLFNLCWYFLLGVGSALDTCEGP